MADEIMEIDGAPLAGSPKHSPGEKLTPPGQLIL